MSTEVTWVAVRPETGGPWHFVDRVSAAAFRAKPAKSQKKGARSLFPILSCCSVRFEQPIEVREIQDLPLADEVCATCKATTAYWSAARKEAERFSCGRCGSPCMARGPATVSAGAIPVFGINCQRCGKPVKMYQPPLVA